MFGGEERGLGVWWVFWSGGHQLDGSHMFISQFPQGSLSVLNHLMHRCIFLKGFTNLSLTQREHREKS